MTDEDQSFDDNRFAVLVQKDLADQTTEDEDDILHGDLQLWRTILGEKVTEIQDEQSMATAKLQAHEISRNVYSSQKVGLAKYKSLVVSRLAEVKLMLREAGQENAGAPHQKTSAILLAILDEMKDMNLVLQEIRDLSKEKQ